MHRGIVRSVDRRALAHNTRRMKLRDALILGRVSNLPTVWTNVAAAAALCGYDFDDARLPLLCLGGTGLYAGGMYLNDAFDAEIDAKERPERPIPAGRVRQATVFRIGFTLLGAGIALFIAAGGWAFRGGYGDEPAFLWPPVFWPMLLACALGATIVVYNRYHKGYALSPLLMGGCRLLLYAAAGAAFTSPPPLLVWAAGGMLFSYVVGLTYVAQHEVGGRITRLWPLSCLCAPLPLALIIATKPWLTAVFIGMLSGCVALALRHIHRGEPGGIPRGVVLLIAGICLFDAALLAGAGQPILAAAAALAFLATRGLQRIVPGT